MKRTIILLMAITFFAACEKDNELESVELTNTYDREIVDFITVENVTPVSCTIFEADFIVHTDRIPNGLEFTHILLKHEDGTVIKFNVTTGLFIESNCMGSTTYTMTLYHEDTQLESRPSQFIYTP